MKSDRVTIHKPIKSSMSREERERVVHVLTQILVTHLRRTEESPTSPEVSEVATNVDA